MDDTFVNVWLDGDEPTNGPNKKDFPKFWLDKASARHSDPSLIGADHLRKQYPKHSVVSTSAFDLNILSFPGLTATPLPVSPLITDVFFAPFARNSNGVPGALIDQVKIGAFTVVWQGNDFLLYIASYPGAYGNTITQSYILHEGPEDPARLLLLNIGAWSHELHDEVWVFNQGFWNKDRGLWDEIQKADWKDVILREEFKRALQKDVYGFFSAEDVYKKLAVPWKRGLIMHGPPGNGKTISVKAIMKSCNDNGFIPLYVKSFQSWKGEEGAMADVFDQARQLSPSCLILEDLDSLINDRNRSYFLNQLDGLESNHGLLIIGTTNHFDRLDPGLSSRPSRFDRKYLFDDPNKEERALYAKYWQNKLSSNSEIDFPDDLIEVIADLTPGFSFAYLKEAFVSTLVTLAGISGDKPPFEKALKDQIHELREQLDKEGPQDVCDTVMPTRLGLRHPESFPPNPGHGVHFPPDASQHHVVQGNAHKKIYSSARIAEARQRGAVYTDQASSSINTNMNSSSPVYRPFTARNPKRYAGYNDHPGNIDDNILMRNPLDRLYISSPDSLEASVSNRVSQRELPTPPGPPGMGWERPTFAEPTLPGAFTRSQGRF
ncbi:hypothetical protein AGABI2DRAFT_192071 [Agaricus bisporus var. bisporus H97]|uniref:hypothetical protein n=1 Tax=Agaricus bisporus var. bisporus (strain H97 / ATCC MYA-4626 / FGSC 10389) TaxID=936046 RepID=UPI00029F69BD|nr:hypothetical protein AGABI2DRAFT_192071 [Agaricus bisporus var. bisporus H97]EKV48469.1 hypothetical protein AGABI2DRAFT_192071 [Agaricus bisporus var. bisporus H97]